MFDKVCLTTRLYRQRDMTQANCHGGKGVAFSIEVFNQSDNDVTPSEGSLIRVINPSIEPMLSPPPLPSIIVAYLELVREPSRLGRMFGFAVRKEFNLLVFPSVEVLLLVFAGVEESNP